MLIRAKHDPYHKNPTPGKLIRNAAVRVTGSPGRRPGGGLSVGGRKQDSCSELGQSLFPDLLACSVRRIDDWIEASGRTDFSQAQIVETTPATSPQCKSKGNSKLGASCSQVIQCHSPASLHR